MPDTRPNVLWYSLEDTSPRFGCYGDDIAETPTLDGLAENGVRYPNACSTAGVCAPSRNAIITGCYQTRTGGHHMRTKHTHPDAPDLPTPYGAVPPHYVRAFTERLREAGYYCSNNDKTDYQFEPNGDAPVTAWDASHSGAHWRDRADDQQPFFSVFNPTRTHESGMWPDDTPPETDPAAVEIPEYLPDTPGVREQIARQYDNIAQSDAELSDLLDQLEADRELENTYIFIWSDHGEGLPRAKRSLYDSGINIPLIVAGPDLPAGEVRDAPISLVDLGPTVLELTGVEPPPWMDGQPFLGDGPDVRERDAAFAARDRMDETYDMVRAVRSRQYKYIRNYYPANPRLQWIPYRAQGPAMQDLLDLHAAGELEPPMSALFEPRPAEELYDLHGDPHETNNLATDPTHRETLVEHRRLLDEWRAEYDPWGERSERSMVEAMHGPDASSSGNRQTAAPIFVPNAPGNRTREPVTGGDLEAPATLLLHCSTQGASIAVALDADPGERDGHHEGWDLYTGPLRLPAGETTVYAKAVRYGYEESDTVRGTFVVEDG